MTSVLRFSHPSSLDDWPRLRDFWLQFLGSSHGHRIEVSKDDLQSYLMGCLLTPQTIGLLLGWKDEILTGVIAVKTGLFEDPRMCNQMMPACFIAGVYVLPTAGRRFSRDFNAYLEIWAKNRNLKQSYGHARIPKGGLDDEGNPIKGNNYKFNAVMIEYGYEPVHIVVRKLL